MEIKIGTNAWYIDNGKVSPFSVNFISNNEALMEKDGQFIKVAISNLYPTKEMAERKLQAKDFIAVCREVCKQTGQVAVYELDCEVDSGLIGALKIRGRFNPELIYFVTKKETFEEHKELFQNVNGYKLLVEKNLAVQL